MAELIIFTLFLGIILGLTLSALFLWLIQVKCPQCKQLKPLKEIILWHWKQRTITGQPCPKCRQVKPQIQIEL